MQTEQLSYEELEKQLKTVVGQYDAVVKQNKSLQQELNKLKQDAILLPWQDGRDSDFGAFVLKRYMWFNSAFGEVVGCVDVEYKQDKHRRIYIGTGSGDNENSDILKIANYGDCIKELGYGE